MPTFEEPWGWWGSLANLTQWLWWPAWGAVFSLWALLNTARLADRQNHRERRKDSVFVYAAGRLLDDANTPFQSLAKSFNRGPQQLLFFEAASEFFVENKFKDQIESFSTNQFPTLKSMQDFRYAEIRLVQICAELRHSNSKNQYPDMEELSMWASEVDKASKRLVDHAEKLVSANEWARLHDRAPPYSWAGFTKSLKSMPTWARTTLIRLSKRKPAETQ